MINKEKFKNRKISFWIFILFCYMFFLTTGTYAYLSYSSRVEGINGNMGIVDLELDVTKILPAGKTNDSLLIFRFDELASNLNDGCIDSDGEFSLCQLYKINLKNKKNTVNTKVKGSLSFSNANMPNLSWILLGNNYNSSINYTESMLGNTFNTASSSYTNFVDDYLLYSGDEVDFYILLWINETDELQFDKGTYSGIVRFEDHKGTGVTAEFGDD